MRYNVFIKTISSTTGNGIRESLLHTHRDAPCWGRISKNYVTFSTTGEKFMSRVEWMPVIRYHKDGIKEVNKAEEFINQWIKLFDSHQNEGNFSVAIVDGELKVNVDLENAPKTSTVYRMMMLRNLIEYVGCHLLYFKLREQKVPARIAMFIASGIYVGMGYAGVDYSTLSVYTNDSMVIDTTVMRMCDVNRYLYPRKGRNRHPATRINRTFKESREGYQKGTVMSSICNPLMNINTKPLSYALNTWDGISALVSDLTGRTYTLSGE